MIRTYRYPLRPTRAQEAVLTEWLAKCCQLYNAALEQRIAAWKTQRVSLSRYDQQKQLTELRSSDADWVNMACCAQRSALERIDRAFKSFFRRARAGECPGFPRYKKSQRYDSFSIHTGQGGGSVDGKFVRVPKLGKIRYHRYREHLGKVVHIHISGLPSGWSVSLTCDIGLAPSKNQPMSMVGIDVGLETFATLSNGERLDRPGYGRDGSYVISRRQRSFSRKRQGSNSSRAAKRLIAIAHEHIRNQRIDFARKLAAALYSRFDMIAHEDLQIARMVHGNLAKYIYDAAWGQFLDALRSKAENAGKWCIAVDPRWTSQICAACGTVVKKELSEREHRCDCGFVAHRDHNAALNILARGLRVGQLTEATRVAEPVEAVSTELS
jgi:putative transposase